MPSCEAQLYSKGCQSKLSFQGSAIKLKLDWNRGVAFGLELMQSRWPCAVKPTYNLAAYLSLRLVRLKAT